jgi:hypothetical protein
MTTEIVSEFNPDFYLMQITMESKMFAEWIGIEMVIIFE